MTKLDTTISTVLEQFNCQRNLGIQTPLFQPDDNAGEKLNITEPCKEFYVAFIADDNSSHERHSLHVRCVKLVDESAGTQAKDAHGILINEPCMPG